MIKPPLGSSSQHSATYKRFLDNFKLVAGRSWATVTGGASSQLESSLLVQGETKLKASASDFIRMNHDYWLRTNERLQHDLFGKFLDKAFLLEHVKLVLVDKWKSWGGFHIGDLLVGYYLTWCENQELMNNLSLKNHRLLMAWLCSSLCGKKTSNQHLQNLLHYLCGYNYISWLNYGMKSIYEGEIMIR